MRLSAEKLAEQISRFVNGASTKEVEELAKLMSNDHPTLQQSKMRLACLYVEEMANKTRVDARNESSKKLAENMIKGHKEASIKKIVDTDGVITDTLKDFIINEALPSKSLGSI